MRLSFRQVLSSENDFVDGSISLANGAVLADVVAARGEFISIYSWSSRDPGRGNTILALKELKRKFKAPISVHDIGEVGTESYNYWIKMKSLNLVDFILDENDNILPQS